MPDPAQPRKTFEENSLQELATSLRRKQLKPLTVVYDQELQKYKIEDGERRYRAAQIANLPALDCVVREDPENPQETLLNQIIHNWIRSDLLPYETADALVRLRDEHKLNQMELSRLTGKPQTEIARLLALVDNVVPEVQERVRSSQYTSLSKRHLYVLSQLEPRKQKTMAARIEREQITAIDFEERLKADKPLSSSRPTKRGRPTTRLKYQTDNGSVLLTFHRKADNVTLNDVYAALDQAKDIAAKDFLI